MRRTRGRSKARRSQRCRRTSPKNGGRLRQNWRRWRWQKPEPRAKAKRDQKFRSGAKFLLDWLLSGRLRKNNRLRGWLARASRSPGMLCRHAHIANSFRSSARRKFSRHFRRSTACLWEAAWKAKLRSNPRTGGNLRTEKRWRPSGADRRRKQLYPFCPKGDRDSRREKSRRGCIPRRARRAWFPKPCAKHFWILAHGYRRAATRVRRQMER